ncbi:MAG: FAD/NAD(P)-binding protein [Acidimicrobiia bacterium]|nr:FAD/NAD(P)-binding protein [Acidimicrobiia bacterium]
MNIVGAVPAQKRALSDLLIPRPYLVADKTPAGRDTWTLNLVPTEGELPEFLPAQCSMLGAFGVGEAAISISSPMWDRTHHGYTIRDAGPITSALVETPVGGVITVRGPFGTPWPLNRLKGSTLLVVAGGLGLAPLRAAIEAASDGGLDRVIVFLGAKEPSEILYRESFERWERGGAEVHVTIDTAIPGWDGPIGLVTDLIDGSTGVQLDWTDTTAFVCGPDVMMHFTAEKLVEVGMSTSDIWITLERNMQCGHGLCGHCQLGPVIVCRDGPVVNYRDIEPFHWIPEL